VATDYGGAYGGQPWHAGQPPYGGRPPYGGQPPYRGQPSYGGQPPNGGQRRHDVRPARRGRAGLAIAVAGLVLGVAGLAISLTGAATQVLPRQFTAGQQRQITDWEVGNRWRLLPAGTIFPASVQYSPPVALDDDSALMLTAKRIGVARQASCAAATDAAAAAVLTRNGCAAVLRATYVDGTGSYVVTVGVAVLPGLAQASAANRELASARGAGGVRPGVRAVRFKGTLAAWFTNGRRQISASIAGGTYVFMYTVGYADDRPQVPVTADSYADAEMTAAGEGVVRAVSSTLAASVPPPHCPGTPGC
jgi:hypothetical protein